MLHPDTKENPKAWYYKGKIYVSLYTANRTESANLLTEAVDAFIQADELDFDDEFKNLLTLAMSNVGNYLYQEGLNSYNDEVYFTAVNYFEYAEKVALQAGRIDSFAIYNIGLVYEKAGDYEKAIHHYQRSIELDFRSNTAYWNIIRIYEYDLGDKEKALEIAKEATEKHPYDRNLITQSINLFLATENAEGALQGLNNMIDSGIIEPIYFYSRGMIYSMTGDHEKAESDYKMALELDPEYFDALYNLGAYYFNAGLERINEANEEATDEGYLRVREEGRNYLRIALEYLEKAHQIDEQKPVVIQALMQMYASLNMTEEYVQMREKLSALGY